MLPAEDKWLTPAECMRAAARYAAQAYCEPRPGMRMALLDLAQSCQALGEQIERLDIVREINSPPRAPAFHSETDQLMIRSAG